MDEITKNFLYYETAKKQLEIYIDSISNEYKILDNYNPINHTKTRIKTTESIIGKLKRKKLPVTIENAMQLNDIVGARIIVDFIENIYEVLEKLKANKNLTIIEEKDYITNPKKSGYRGYHVIVSLPVSISGNTKNINCEIQIRTTAMDFWATNEHKLNYKSKSHTIEYQNKWIDASEKIWDLDIFMNELYLEEKKLNQNLKANEYFKSINVLKSLEKISELKKFGDNFG